MSPASRRRYDLVVVGAGILGLAHAFLAARAGLSVAVVERNAGIAGASVRNFGHLCFTAQSGKAYEYGQVSRQEWFEAAEASGFWLSHAGSVVVARTEAESAVLDDFARDRGPSEAVRLTADQVLAQVPVRASAGVTSGLHLPRDLQVDPRQAAPALAAHLARVGVEFHWRTTFYGVSGELVSTSRGDFAAARTVVAVNHDVDQLFPELAEAVGITRCALDMVLVRGEPPLTYPLLTGWSVLRYGGFAGSPALPRVRQELHAALPEGARLDLNQMFTGRPDGSIVVGDTHRRVDAEGPFQPEAGFDLILGEAAKLLELRGFAVLERWQGVYASAPGDFLIAAPQDSVRVVSVTTGVGMTTSFGVATAVISELLQDLAVTKSERYSRRA